MSVFDTTKNALASTAIDSVDRVLLRRNNFQSSAFLAPISVPVPETLSNASFHIVLAESLLLDDMHPRACLIFTIYPAATRCVRDDLRHSIAAFSALVFSTLTTILFDSLHTWLLLHTAAENGVALVSGALRRRGVFPAPPQEDRRHGTQVCYFGRAARRPSG